VSVLFNVSIKYSNYSINPRIGSIPFPLENRPSISAERFIYTPFCTAEILYNINHHSQLHYPNERNFNFIRNNHKKHQFLRYTFLLVRLSENFYRTFRLLGNFLFVCVRSLARAFFFRPNTP
jgi:hypothetical protein